MAERGQLVVIEANPRRYVLKRKTPMLDGPCYAPPVLANGLLYIRNENLMLCCDVRGGGEASHPPGTVPDEPRVDVGPPGRAR